MTAENTCRGCKTLIAEHDVHSSTQKLMMEYYKKLHGGCLKARCPLVNYINRVNLRDMKAQKGEIEAANFYSEQVTSLQKEYRENPEVA